MNLIILGSGTSIPLSYRASPSLAMIVKDRVVLFDMGPGTVRQLARAGIGHDRIEHIFIGHFHPDHTADLVHFLFITRNLKNLEGRRPFIITGPSGTGGFLEKIKAPYNRWLDLPDYLMQVEELDVRDTEKRSYDNYEITSRPTGHTSSSLAFRVSGADGKSFVYSGDTDFSEVIAELAEETDLLILECSLPEGKGVEGHLTPSEAGRIASLAKARKLLLLHFYPEVLATDISRDCRKTYEGELILGRDMLSLSVL